MAFLKQKGTRGTALGITSHDWPQFTEEGPEIYEQEVLDKFFAECGTTSCYAMSFSCELG